MPKNHCQKSFQLLFIEFYGFLLRYIYIKILIANKTVDLLYKRYVFTHQNYMYNENKLSNNRKKLLKILFNDTMLRYYNTEDMFLFKCKPTVSLRFPCFRYSYYNQKICSYNFRYSYFPFSGNIKYIHTPH